MIINHTFANSNYPGMLLCHLYHRVRWEIPDTDLNNRDTEMRHRDVEGGLIREEYRSHVLEISGSRYLTLSNRAQNATRCCGGFPSSLTVPSSDDRQTRDRSNMRWALMFLYR